MATVLADSYRLARDMAGSTRLDAQHMVWEMHSGWTMNPAIPISPDMRIAEVGTGTSIWLLALASRLPQTVTLHGYDVSDGQFPPLALLPPNVTLSTMNAFEPPPEHLVGTYDVVHMRLWTLVVTGNDPSRVIEHAKSLLKPGGHLQWEDALLSPAIVHGEQATAYMNVFVQIMKALDFNNDWLANLPDHVKKGGLEVLDFYRGRVNQVALPLATTTYAGAMYEFLKSLDASPHGDESLPSSAECQALLLKALEDFRRGEAQFVFTAIVLLARKPLEGSS